MHRLLLLSGGAYLSDLLIDEGFEVRRTEKLHAAFAEVSVWQPDAVLIEVLFQDGEALGVCRSIREAHDIPVVVCSPSGRESDVVRALDAGADDYLVMPVRPLELVARLRAVVRRTTAPELGRQSKDRLFAGDLEIRLDEHRVFKNGAPVDLSPTEFRLLISLAKEPGRVMSHRKLMAQVWGSEYVDCKHYLRLYIRYLRSKLETHPDDPRLILSEWGIGYRLAAD